MLEQPPTKATKAIFGGLMAACGAVATVFADGAVTIPEVAIAVAGVVGVVATVFGVTNKPKET